MYASNCGIQLIYAEMRSTSLNHSPRYKISKIYLMHSLFLDKAICTKYSFAHWNRTVSFTYLLRSNSTKAADLSPVVSFVS